MSEQKKYTEITSNKIRWCREIYNEYIKNNHVEENSYVSVSYFGDVDVYRYYHLTFFCHRLRK